MADVRSACLSFGRSEVRDLVLFKIPPVRGGIDVPIWQSVISRPFRIRCGWVRQSSHAEK
jgi:hypothetical protein